MVSPWTVSQLTQRGVSKILGKTSERTEADSSLTTPKLKGVWGPVQNDSHCFDMNFRDRP
jgi:hypothetical protein